MANRKKAPFRNGKDPAATLSDRVRWLSERLEVLEAGILSAMASGRQEKND
jgi:hypothetical protein